MTGLPTIFTRPSLVESRDEARAAYAAALAGTDPFLRRGLLPAFPHVDAAMVQDLHAHVDWIALQASALYATGIDLDLLHGRLWGVERKPAGFASGAASFTGTDGAQVLTGAALTGSDGLAFTVTAGGTVAGGTVTVTVTADAAGADGNRDAGAALTLTSPPAGIDPAGAAAAGGLTGGTDVEPDGAMGVREHYRGRILERIQQPPHGAALFDYPVWAKTVAEVTDAWAAENEQGRGSVTVRVMTYGATGDGIPAAGTLTAVAAVLEDLRPPGIELFVAAPVAVPLDVTIADLTPDTPSVRAAVEAELAALIRRIAAPGVTVPVSRIWEAVSIASGETSHDLTAPAASVTHAVGEIPVMGTVSYV